MDTTRRIELLQKGHDAYWQGYIVTAGNYLLEIAAGGDFTIVKDNYVHLNFVAWMSRMSKKYKEAETEYLQSLYLQRKKAFGKPGSDYATTLNYLADLYKEIKEYSKAEICYSQALDLQKAGVFKKERSEEHTSELQSP